MSDEDNREPSPVGWDAIDRALAPIYGEGEPPYHYGPILPAMLGGRDPLQGISIYDHPLPVPHWHFVTYGFSELYEKESDDPEVSGFGFELTFRLAQQEEEPPAWALNFLQNLGRYVFQTGNGFDIGHYLDCQGPIALGQETDIRAVVFARDPELGETDTPNGHLQFLQVVGITLDELLLIKKWDAKGFLDLLGRRVPLLVTDLRRTSILRVEAVRQEAQRRADQEGSSTAFLAVGEAHFRQQSRGGLLVVLGANGVIDLKEVLPARLKFGRPLLVLSRKGRVEFCPGEEAGWRESEEKGVEITLTADQSQRLAVLLQPKAGKYTLPDVPRLVFEVRKSEIKDQDGNVVQVIG